VVEEHLPPSFFAAVRSDIGAWSRARGWSPALSYPHARSAAPCWPTAGRNWGRVRGARLAHDLATYALGLPSRAARAGRSRATAWPSPPTTRSHRLPARPPPGPGDEPGPLPRASRRAPGAAGAPSGCTCATITSTATPASPASWRPSRTADRRADGGRGPWEIHVGPALAEPTRAPRRGLRARRRVSMTDTRDGTRGQRPACSPSRPWWFLPLGSPWRAA